MYVRADCRILGMITEMYRNARKCKGLWIMSEMT